MRIRKKDAIDDSLRDTDLEFIASISDALAHPARLQLLRFIMKQNRRMQNVCTKDLVEEFDYAQATISQHMKKLVKSGLIESKKKERYTYYFLNLGMLTKYLKATQKFAVLKD